MPSLTCKNDVQRLNGKITTLNRFVSSSLNKAHGFFMVLNGLTNFEWTEECENDFGELKHYLLLSPLFVKPDERDILQLYLAVLDNAMSLVLVKNFEREQRLMFYVSKILLNAETRYTHMEKFIYALVLSS